MAIKNKIGRILMGLALGTLWALPLGALDIRLDVKGAEELAIKNNLNLKSEGYSFRMKKRARDFSWNAFIPKLSVNGTLSRTNQAPSAVTQIQPGAPGASPGEWDTFYFLNLEPEHYWNLSAGLTARLDLSLALANGIRYTVLEYEAGSIRYEKAVKELVRDVRKAFYNLLVLKESIALFELRLDTAEKRYLSAKENFQAGLASEFQLLSTQVAWENMKPALEDIKIGYRLAELYFKLLLGLNQGDNLILSGSLEPEIHDFDQESLIQQFLSHRLDLQLLTNNIQALKNNQAGIFNQAFIPVLSLMYSADPFYNPAKDPFQGGWFDDMEKDWTQRSGMFSLTLSMPLDGLIPGSHTQIELKNMDDQIAALELRLQEAVRGAWIEVEGILLNLEKSQRTLGILKLNEKLAGKAFQMAEEGYQNGSRNLIELKNAEDELHKARFDTIKEKYNYISAFLDLEYALNSSGEQLLSNYKSVEEEK